jgi:hypothetical protein
LHFYDINDLLVNKIANTYNGKVIKDLTDNNLSNIDCFNICTPTETHNELLKKGINSKIPLIICEKPISNQQKELNDLLKLYNNNSTKILVNYFRRFQPAYKRLKSFITFIQKNEQLVNIREPLQLIYEMFKIGVEEKGLDFFLKFEESVPKTQILVD